MRGGLAILAALMLTACGTVETARQANPPLTLPPMNTFGPAAPERITQSNTSIARDFMDLTFVLENGERMPRFTRFEGPIRLRVLGNSPASLDRDLDRLLGRFQREARIDISRVEPTSDADITVQTVTRRQIQRVAPTAACFVRPNVSNWSEYRARRNDPDTFWNRLVERKKMAIFLPIDVSPQEIRDCLAAVHQQALIELPKYTDEELEVQLPEPHAAFDTKLGSLFFCHAHEMIHCGQIGMLRRMLGKDPLR